MMTIANRLSEENDTCCFRMAQQGGLRVLWELTHRCNQNCVHCLIGEGRENEYSSDKVTEIADMIINDNVRKVILTGGEPLLHKECLSIGGRLRKAGVEVDISTNATLINKETADFLGDNGIDCSISFDGPSPEVHDSIRATTGALSKTLSGVTYLRQAGVNLQALMSITTLNYKYVIETIDLAIKAGFTIINLMGLLPVGRAADNNVIWLDKKQIEELKDMVVEARERFEGQIKIRTTRLFARPPFNICEAGRTFVHIDPIGRVTPCSLLSIPEKFDSYVPNQSINSILKNPQFVAFRESLKIDSLKERILCNSACEHYDYCGRGCRGIGKSNPDPLCPFYSDY